MLPVALTLKHLNAGIAYAIDPWDRRPATEGSLSEWDQKFWQDHFDGKAILKEFIEAVREFGVADHVRIIQTTSQEASRIFADASIDYLHLDGNHSPEASTLDVRLWLPKVKPGGCIVFDDAERDTTQAALRLLGMGCHSYFREYWNAEGSKWRVYERY